MDTEKGVAVEQGDREDQERQDYADVDITDDFMFSYIMRNPDICMELLQYMFPGHKNRKVRYIYDTDSGQTQNGQMPRG